MRSARPAALRGTRTAFADLPATADLGGVILQEAVLAVRAGEGELLESLSARMQVTMDRTASAACAAPLIAHPLW